MGKLLIGRQLLSNLDSGEYELYEDTEEGTTYETRRGKLVARARVFYDSVLLRNDVGYFELEIPGWDYTPNHLIITQLQEFSNGTENNQQDGGQEHRSPVRESTSRGESLQDPTAQGEG